jgi:predicted nuclease with TOPRIM domain
MRDQLEARLTELENEYEIGERQLREIDLHQARLRETLLRMSGAIQVLRELLNPAGTNVDRDSAQVQSSVVGASAKTDVTGS